MVNWQLTATKIYCDEAGSDVTIIVHKDWSAKCCLYGRHDKGSIRTRDEMLHMREWKCGRLSGNSQICARMQSYIDELLEEEKV